MAADHVSVDVTLACSLGHEGVVARATPAQIARVVRTEAIVLRDSVDDDKILLLLKTSEGEGVGLYMHRYAV